MIGDRRIFEEGARIAGIKPALKMVEEGPIFAGRRTMCCSSILVHLDPKQVEPKTATLSGGRVRAGAATSMRARARPRRPCRCGLLHPLQQAGDAARPRESTDDEIAFSAEVAGLKTAASEFNVLDRLWNARITSTFRSWTSPLRLSGERIHRALKLTRLLYA